MKASEDGHAIAIIRTESKDTNVVCNGLKCNGNSYLDLIEVLKKKEIVSNTSNSFMVFIKREFLWELVNEKLSTFSNGDSLLIIARTQKKKKAIRKNPRIII